MPEHDTTDQQDSMTGGLYGLKGLLKEAVDKTDRLIERSIASTPAAPAPPAKSHTPPGGIKLPLVLLVVGIVSAAAGAGFSHRGGSDVVKTRNPMMDGLARMREKNYAQAAATFGAIQSPPDRAAALAKEAECLFYFDAEDDKALKALDDLEQVQCSHPMLPYLRGLIAERQGDHLAAREYYKAAELLGCRLAHGRLAKVGRK